VGVQGGGVLIEGVGDEAFAFVEPLLQAAANKIKPIDTNKTVILNDMLLAISTHFIITFVILYHGSPELSEPP
jgi:hypothetical protein